MELLRVGSHHIYEFASKQRNIFYCLTANKLYP